MKEFYTIKFPESSMSEAPYNDPLYRASEILRAYIYVDELEQNGVSLTDIVRCLRKSVVAPSEETDKAVVKDVVVSGNEIKFCVVDNYSTVRIDELLVRELGKDLRLSYQLVFDDGVSLSFDSVCLSGKYPLVYKDEAAIEPKRYIVEKPGWQFSDIIHSAKIEIEQIEESENGILVSITDPGNLLNGMFMGNRTMFESHDVMDSEHSVLAGPYPVIDVDILFDRLFGVYSSIDIHTIHGDVGSVSYSEVEEYMSKKHPFIVGNICMMDFTDAGRELEEFLEPDFDMTRLCERFCSVLKEHVEERMNMLSYIHELDRFVSPETRKAVLYEKAFIKSVSGLKGLKHSDNPAKGTRVGCVDGYEVFIKERFGGADKLFGKYVSLRKSGESVGFVNAVRDGSIPVYKIMGKAYSEAKAKDKTVRVYERIKQRFGFSSKKSRGQKK